MGPPLRGGPSGLGNRGMSGPGNSAMASAFKSMDRSGQGTVTIEELQQALLNLDLVPAAPNQALLELFQSCDRGGGGNIDYQTLTMKLKTAEAKGMPMFVPGYQGGGSMSGAGSRLGSRANPGSVLQAATQRS